MTLVEARSILRLSQAFSGRDLKRAYRRAAAANHPDRGGNVHRMVLVNEAYEVLSRGAPSEVPERSDYRSPSTPFVEAFRRYTGIRPRNPHPLDRYAVAVAAGLAVVAWIAGMIDAFNDFGTLRGWIVLGLPLSYVVTLIPVRVIFRVGVHVYNFGLKVRDWMGHSVREKYPDGSRYKRSSDTSASV
jgi:DnaJ-like protein